MEVERSTQQQAHASSTLDNNNNGNTISSPRISFSCDLDDDDHTNANNVISIIDLSRIKTDHDNNNEIKQQNIHSTQNFEFLSDVTTLTQRDMPSADELFFEGKLLPYWQTHHSEKLKSLKLNSEEIEKAVVPSPTEAVVVLNVDDVKEESRVRTWFIDDDPSPRPPKCTVLWKELLKLKSRQKGSTLSPSSSSSSSSSSTSSLDMSKEKVKEKESSNGGKNVKRVKKGLERTRSASIRIRPMVNVPICTQHVRQSSSGGSSALPPLFPMRRGRPTF